MILVIADDVTGATEIGGIALRYGLKVIVADEANINFKADVLVLYTNTRSMSEREAVKVMADLTKKASQLKPSLFYKKTDSVLRGHILAEMNAQMEELRFGRGLLVPVNPFLGRIISEGQYYVNGEQIHHTSFSQDPEFPIKTSNVLEIMGDKNFDAKIVKLVDSLPENGVLVGEAKSREDVVEWANKVDKNTLAAGGGSFFDALLSRRYPLEKKDNIPVKVFSPLLLISGTAFQKNVRRIKQYSHLVSYMPAGIFGSAETDDSNFEQWKEEIMRKLSKNNKAIIAIDNSAGQKGDPDLLRKKKAKIVELIIKEVEIKELLIEGGATAYSIIKEIGWQSFIPTEELQQGIVRMQVEGVRGLHLTIKPGSYDWPNEWNFN